MKPTGNVTFLFTDIEGSTRLSQKFPDSLQSALNKHHSILNTAIQSNNGFVFEIVGDAFCCAFEKAHDAVKAAVDAQLALSIEKWDEAVIKIRIGIHSGNAEWNGDSYMGYITLARSARVMSAAFGEQILISENAYELCKYEITISSFSFRDLGERRLKDVIQPIRLYQIAASGLREDFPPLNTLDSRPNNLPVQLTSFIGREDEIKQIKSLLKQTHLLTLKGSGGVGKTRLALQSGADIIDEFSNGVFIVSLASLDEPSLILQTISKSLGLKESQNLSPEEMLSGYLKEKEILIILDNCEHLINDCSKISEMLLRKCQKLKIISTSREALNCSGELVYPVQPLSIPDISEQISPERLTQFESVRLFIERALAINPTFRVNNQNAPFLAELCSRLDGIPLAIELAVARIKILPLEKICERLSDRFRLLTGGTRTALPRQQTLRALIDWSYELLSENEKTLFRRLSLFSGFWNIDSAEEICSGNKIDRDEIFDLLNSLSEKSIIIYDIENERFHLLETLKQYGKERLVESEEEENIKLRYIKYYLQMSESIQFKLNGKEMNVSLDKLESENVNILSVIEMAFQMNKHEESVRLALAMGTFWKIRAYNSTARFIYERILNDPRDVSKLLYARVLQISGILYERTGNIDKAKNVTENSLKIFRELNEKKFISDSLNSLGNLAIDNGDYKKAAAFYEESLLLRRELDDRARIATSLLNLGIVYDDIGETGKAKSIYLESLEISKEIGDMQTMGNVLNNLGNIAINWSEAKKFYLESLKIKHEIGDKSGLASTLDNLGIAETGLGNYEEAQKYYEESLFIKRKIEDKRGVAISLLHLSDLFVSYKDFPEARKLIEESILLRKEIGEKTGIAMSVEGLGNIEYALCNYKQAEMNISESLKLFRETGFKLGEVSSLKKLGDICYELGNTEGAIKFYKESLQLGVGDKGILKVSDALPKLSVILAEKGYLKEALRTIICIEGSIDDLDLSDRSLIEGIRMKAKDQLSESEFSKLIKEGKELTVEQAFRLIENLIL